MAVWESYRETEIEGKGEKGREFWVGIGIEEGDGNLGMGIGIEDNRDVWATLYELSKFDDVYTLDPKWRWIEVILINLNFLNRDFISRDRIGIWKGMPKYCLNSDRM